MHLQGSTLRGLALCQGAISLEEGEDGLSLYLVPRPAGKIRHYTVITGLMFWAQDICELICLHVLLLCRDANLLRKNVNAQQRESSKASTGYTPRLHDVKILHDQYLIELCSRRAVCPSCGTNVQLTRVLAGPRDALT